MDNEGNIPLEKFQQLSVLFNNLLKLLNKFKLDLASVTVPKDTTAQLQQIEKKMQGLADLNKELGSKKSGLSRSWGITADGESTDPSKAQKNRVAANLLGVDTLAPGTNKIITSYEQLEDIVTDLLKLNRELTSSEQEVMSIWEQVQQALKQGAQQAVKEWEQTNAQINLNKEAIKELGEEYKQVSSQGLVDSKTSDEVKEEVQAITNLSDTLTTEYTAACEQARAATDKKNQEQEETSRVVQSNNKITQEQTKVITANTGAVKQQQTTLGKAINNVVSYGTALNIVRTVYNRLISTITEMDKALTDMTVVTSLTREEAWNLTGTLTDLAKQTGMTTTAVAEMTTKYLQQGKTLGEAIELTEAAAKAARIAGIDGSASIKLLTNAMNGFQISANKAMEVSDKFAALAASAATDYEQLATALSKVAAQANLAGMSMDFTLGLLTKGIEVTQEAPETIGTALKTVIARMRELTDYGATLEDGIDVNRVAKALDNIGVSLLDDNRQFRDLEIVLTEVGEKWESLNTNQQANVAVALAGTRQQSRLIAMMQDFNRTQELVKISMTSAGATAAQHRKYMQGLEAATTNLTTSFQQLITTFTNSDFAINALNDISKVLEFLSEHIGLIQVALVGVTAAMLPLAIAKGKALLAESMSTVIMATNNVLLEQQRVKQAENKTAQLDATIATEKDTLAQQNNNLVALETIKTDQQRAIQTNLNVAADKKAIISLIDKQIAFKNTAIAALQLQQAESESVDKQAKIQQKINKINGELEASTQRKAQAQQELDAAEKQAAEDSKALKETELAIEKQKAEITQTNNKIYMAEQAKMIALDIIANKGKISGLKLQMQQIIASKLEAQGIDSVTAAKIAEIMVIQPGNVLKALWNKLTKKQIADESKLVASIAGTTAAHTANTAVLSAETAATVGLTVATKALDKASKTAGIVGLIILIASAILTIAYAISEMEEFTDLMNSLKNVGKQLWDIIQSLLDIIMQSIRMNVTMFMPALKVLIVLLDIIVQAIGVLGAVLEGASKSIVTFYQAIGQAIANIPGLGTAINKVVGFFKGASGPIKQATKAITDWFNKICDDMLYVTGNTEQKLESLSKKIASNQDKLYDNKQKHNTLQPLLDEYTKLSNKAIKSTEDLERLKAIEEEVSQFEEGKYKDEHGNILWDAVKNDLSAINVENEKLLQEIKQYAFKGIQDTGRVTEEIKTGLADVYADKVLKDSELSVVEQKEIQTKIQNAFNTFDYSKVKGLNAQKLDTVFSGISQAIMDLDKDLRDADDLSQMLTTYNEKFTELEKSATGAGKAIESVYPYLAELSKLATESGIQIDELANKLKLLGWTESDYSEVKAKFFSTIQRNQGESDEAYAIRQEQEWQKYFAKALKENNTKSAIVNALLTGTNNQAFKNSVVHVSFETNQMLMEGYVKKMSGYDNIAESASKAKAGTLSNEELRQIFEENADIFSNYENVKAFMAGNTAFLTDARAKATAELQNELRQRQLTLAVEIADAQKEGDQDKINNLLMQNNLIKQQLDNLNYQDLYTLDIWKNYANQTKEQQAQIRLTRERNQLEKEYAKLTNNEAKIDNIKQRQAIAAAEKAKAESLLNSKNIKDLQNIGVEFVDGEIILDISRVKSMFGDDYETNQQYINLMKWADENQENIKEAQEVVDNYEETVEDFMDEYRDIITEQYEKEKEVLEQRKQSYEDYWSKLDGLQQEEERAQSRQNLIDQIAALSGGSGSATNNLRKQLISQLNDLNKEEEQARKQAMRDALTQSIEKHITSIDNKLDKLDKLSSSDIVSLMATMGYNMGNYIITYGTNKAYAGDMSHGEIRDKDGKLIKAFKEGGLVNFTGPAWVDGTTSKPEAFLNASQTKMMQELMFALNQTIRMPDIGTEPTNTVNIGAINISTQQLNDSQDFRTAGQIFAEEFDKAIRKRGININVKK